MGEFAQVAAFVASLREQPGISAHALEFLILTAARTGETLGATWDEKRRKLIADGAASVVV